MRRFVFVLFAAFASVVTVVALQGPRPVDEPFDVLIRNGRLMDGSGNPWVRGDVGIRAGRIAAIGRLGHARATRVVDAADRVVTPGFIDVHSHAGEGLARLGLQQGRPLLAQGVTTIFANPDGGGPTDLARQREAFEALGLGVNVGLLVGHGSVREAVMGVEERPPTDEELARMQAMVRAAMAQGAFGLSSGLFYVPGQYATTEEVVALMRVVAEYGGLHTSHIRDEGDYSVGLVAAVREIIRIAEETGTVGIVSHMKALGPDNWGLSVAATTRIDEARRRGVQVFVDQYPYAASSTSLTAALVPGWAQAGGRHAMLARFESVDLRPRILAEVREHLRRRNGAEAILVAHYGPDRRFEGQHLGDIARGLDLAPEEAVLALLAKGGVSIVSFTMSDRDIDHIMRQPYTMTSSDGGLVFPTEGRPHPRNYGAFPRKIAQYVFGRSVVGLEDAIRSMTGLPSQVFSLADRGVLREGAWADVLIFDPAAVRDTATYADPHQLAEGMSYVLVNGSVVVDEGRFTDRLAGRVLWREGSQKDESGR
jgi:N-acyl-D-amino-acid deacylase